VFEEQAEATQYVLPLVVRVEKAEPPALTDALETAARAVLAILADERSTGDGEWAEVMAAWQDAEIRKVVRRARGGEWRKAAELPGITVTGATAEVRVYPPIPLDGWPKELLKLQVSGTSLEDPSSPPAPELSEPVLWLNPSLELSAGKAMAQCGHAAHLAWFELSDTDRKAWAETGFSLSVRTPTAARWSTLLTSGLPVVQDAGFTEIDPGTYTVIADHPVLRN
jgi:peptidyl-tRNA hydrolase